MNPDRLSTFVFILVIILITCPAFMPERFFQSRVVAYLGLAALLGNFAFFFFLLYRFWQL